MVKDVWWDNVIFREFAAHFISMSDEQVVRDIRESVVKVINLDESGDSFGANMVRRAKERLCGRHDVAVQNGKQGGRPKKSPQDAPNGNAGVDMSDAGNGAASKSPTSCDQFTADGDIREDSQDRKSGTSANLYGDAATREGAEVCLNRKSGVVVPTTVSDFSGARESTRTDGHSLRVGNVARPPVRNSGRKFRNKEEYMQWAIDSGLDATDASECWDATLERGGKDANSNTVKNMKAFARQWCRTRANNRRTA